MLKPLAVTLCLSAAPLAAQSCGGTFSGFLSGLTDEAVAMGIDRATAQGFLAGARQDQAVLAADRGQGFFQRDFIDFDKGCGFRFFSSRPRITNARGYLQSAELNRFINIDIK